MPAGACTDVETPGYSCALQKGWGQCNQYWMQQNDYCAKTCGRCSAAPPAAAPTPRPTGIMHCAHNRTTCRSYMQVVCYRAPSCSHLSMSDVCMSCTCSTFMRGQADPQLQLRPAEGMGPVHGQLAAAGRVLRPDVWLLRCPCPFCRCAEQSCMKLTTSATLHAAGPLRLYLCRPCITNTSDAAMLSLQEPHVATKTHQATPAPSRSPSVHAALLG